MASWLWSSSPFDEAVDKATSELLPTDGEDIVLNLEICDQIKAKTVPPLTAMRALKRRLNHKNPNVQLLALTLTDVCVKNGGNHFLAEIAGREFIDNLVSILKIPGLNIDVKNRILRYVQNWAIALEGKPQFLYISTAYKTLQKEGFVFPPKDLALATDAMTDTAIAPEWVDSDVCLRCRDGFTTFNRKHHCRNCGLIFDHKCSSKALPLPHFGITQAVRVCEACHFKLTKKKEVEQAAKEASEAKKKAVARSVVVDAIDADLQKAIQLSLQESQARPGYTPSSSANRWQISEPPIIDRTTRSEDDEDEQLRAAIEASLREAHAPRPSAPIVEEIPTPIANVPTVAPYELNPHESDAIITFNQTLMSGTVQDPRRVHELSDRAETYRPKLARSLDAAGRKEQLLSEMHTKLSQAVQLYDHLLNEQLSQRTYGSPAPQAQTPYQAQGQWALRRTASPPTTDAAYNPTYNRSPSVPQQSQWTPAAPSAHQTAYNAAPSVSSPVVQYQPPQQQQTYQMLPPVTVQPYQAQAQTQPSAPPQIITSPPPVPISAPPIVATIPGVPPPVQTPTLARHVSLAHRPASMAYPQRAGTGLHRSATLSSAASYTPHPQQAYTLAAQQQSAQTPAQPQQAQPHQVPVQVPVFPTAPTNAPATYSLFGAPQVPAQQPREEPKEALLIEL